MGSNYSCHATNYPKSSSRSFRVTIPFNNFLNKEIEEKLKPTAASYISTSRTINDKKSDCSKITRTNNHKRVFNKKSIANMISAIYSTQVQYTISDSLFQYAAKEKSKIDLSIDPIPFKSNNTSLFLSFDEIQKIENICNTDRNKPVHNIKKVKLNDVKDKAMRRSKTKDVYENVDKKRFKKLINDLNDITAIKESDEKYDDTNDNSQTFLDFIDDFEKGIKKQNLFVKKKIKDRFSSKQRLKKSPNAIIS